ncbi:TetR/AcrR family transcriptional regulator [Sphaerisporangium sp. TRM90804]|uniref:TetR/AcrR family transcriptional regulator n=1 Tax=Sphaerisporangium sp. TRM90804 TaxID=3031113 RepID=UPI0024498142|nr:TetR/AcrR family transcriptional regulator [Sphaerisporangium sp. TRM90804]MDH2425895.1 TetR/AcrR family transcriptional regulator [Sphaerisporangium sp. TRM90804]
MDRETGDILPPSIAEAWGLRGRPHKGPKRGLSLEAIVAAGVKIADTEGIEAASMSRVAKEVGASTMALYRYVGTKDELIALMLDTAIGPPPPLPEGAGWRRSLEHWATAARTTMLAHPWVVPLLPRDGPPVTPNQLAWLDQALQALAGTGLPESLKVSTEVLIMGHVMSEVTIVASQLTDPEAERRWALFTPFLLRVTQDGRLPALRAAAESGAFADADPDPEADGMDEVRDVFAYGLDRVLDGVEAYIRSRRS